ncbi:MAG: hypothetical protein V1755_05595 [Chloroflexota bacterium]
MTTQEHAAQIRTDLKRAGYNSKAISVKCHMYGGGSSINVTIMNPAISKPEIEKLSSGHAGINRFVFIRRDGHGY